MPNHVGIIMDGNRRWARKRGLPVEMGHKKGADVLTERVYDLAEIGVKSATFFAFSTENFKRSADEVNALTRLFETRLDALREVASRNIRLMFIGDLSVFSEKLQNKTALAQEESRRNTGLICRVALNYGGRADIIRAVRAAGDPEISEAAFADNLYAPDADLIIRTGGERRLSNFMLWQAAYAELYFTDALWCDFSKKELYKALDDYAKRNRRYGN